MSFKSELKKAVREELALGENDEIIDVDVVWDDGQRHSYSEGAYNTTPSFDIRVETELYGWRTFDTTVALRALFRAALLEEK